MRNLPCSRLATAIALLGIAAAQAAPPEGKGRPDKGPHGGHAQKADRDDRGGDGDGLRALVSVSISAGEARRYAEELNLVGYSSLPPGIRKNLGRGKPLPPGIAKRMAPQPLIERLPRYEGYEWQVVGADLVLVTIATAVIADVLTDVFR